MPHKFNPRKRWKLDSPERISFLPPEELLYLLGLEKNMIMLDVGAGTGYFSVPASRIVGTYGRVIALDTEAEMIAEINEKIDGYKIRNMETVLSTEYDFNIDGESADFALLCQVLHEVEDWHLFLEEVCLSLKQGGVIGIIEWIPGEADMGPPPEERIEPRILKKLLESAGFADIETGEFNEYFYTARARKRLC